jgi:hypothetical protein
MHTAIPTVIYCILHQLFEIGKYSTSHALCITYDDAVKSNQMQYYTSFQSVHTSTVGRQTLLLPTTVMLKNTRTKEEKFNINCYCLRAIRHRGRRRATFRGVLAYLQIIIQTSLGAQRTFYVRQYCVLWRLPPPPNKHSNTQRDIMYIVHSKSMIPAAMLLLGCSVIQPAVVLCWGLGYGRTVQHIQVRRGEPNARNETRGSFARASRCRGYSTLPECERG